MKRIIDLVLIAAILVGIFQLFRLRQELHVLETEHSRLAALYGMLDVRDPSKFLVTRIETGDPFHFLWRCYYPAGLSVHERVAFGHGGSNTGSTSYRESSEDLHRCHVELKDDSLHFHVLDRGGGGRSGFTNAATVDFIREHWSELEVEILASDGSVEVPPTEVLPFLIIRVPENLLPELRRRCGKRYADAYETRPFFEMVYGTKQALAEFDKRAKQRAQ